ncbi:hypothetical protein FRC07_002505 [Ceratobasidium sp. 392]|nr:hypothetical protein FRC07_002505 [Ceratobasidium sp. 392]
MVPRHPSPAERFRDELGYRLSVDAHLCLPSANVLVGVIIDTMDAIENRSTALSLVTLQNVMSVSEEILSLGRILGVSVLISYASQESIPLSILKDIRFLSLPRMALDGPTCPPALRTRSLILRTYLSIIRILSSYMGPKRVKDLISDFNRPHRQPTVVPEGYIMRRVPGTGPRVIRHEPQKRRISPTVFRPAAKVSQSQAKQSPPPAYQTYYVRNSRGWPVTSKREKSMFTATLSGAFDSKTSSRWSADSSELKQEEAEAWGWKSLRLRLRNRAWL